MVAMIRALALALPVLALLAGCNTVRGVGRDIEAAGDALSDAAGEVQEAIP
jgi:predicted small secreted protein